MIPLLQTKTADTAHTGIFASVTRPSPQFLGGAWGRGYSCPSFAEKQKVGGVSGVTGNPIRAYYDPGGSDPLAELIRWIGFASGSDPPPDQFY